MLGMSFTEIAIILVLALVLLGPDELPKVAKAVGKGLRELRRATDDLKSTFEQEIVKMDDDRPAGPMLVPPGFEAGTSLDQLKDPGAARAAARAAAADPGAARAAARYQAAGLPPPAAPDAPPPAAEPVAPAPLELPAAPADGTASATAPTDVAAVAGPAIGADSSSAPTPRPPPPGSVPQEKKPGPVA